MIDTWAECDALAKKNLCDHTLPRYWTIKNLLIRVHATTEWHEAHKYLLQAEGVYKSALFKYQQKDEYSEADEEVLNNLRNSLDEAQRVQQED